MLQGHCLWLVMNLYVSYFTSKNRCEKNRLYQGRNWVRFLKKSRPFPKVAILFKHYPTLPPFLSNYKLQETMRARLKKELYTGILFDPVRNISLHGGCFASRWLSTMQ